MERLRGVGLDNINAVDKSKALENAKDFIHQCVLPQLQQLKSRHAGGLVDHVVIPPERVRCGGSAIPGYRNHQRLLSTSFVTTTWFSITFRWMKLHYMSWVLLIGSYQDTPLLNSKVPYGYNQQKNGTMKIRMKTKKSIVLQNSSSIQLRRLSALSRRHRGHGHRALHFGCRASFILLGSGEKIQITPPRSPPLIAS